MTIGRPRVIWYKGPKIQPRGPVKLKYDRCFMCDEPPQIRGYCIRHYRQLLKGNTANGHWKEVKVSGYWRKGSWVTPHVQRRLLRGPRELTEWEPPPKGLCKTVGCMQPCMQTGLCQRCWWKEYRKRPEVREREAAYRREHAEEKRAYARAHYQQRRAAARRSASQ